MTWLRNLAAGVVMLVAATSAPARAEVNLTGIFSLVIDGLPLGCETTVTQDGASITLLLECVLMQMGGIGTIDTMTGDFTATGGCTVGPLFGTSTITGTAAPDSSSFVGTLTCPPNALPGIWNYTATRTCPNGTLDGSEECDDGNMAPDDGCSNFCEGMTPPCDDDDPCTHDVIDPDDGCLHLDFPRTGCRTAGKTQLQLKGVGTAAERLTWKWLKGEATTQEGFGVPTGTDAFALCIYAGSGQATVARVDIPADATKWQAITDKGWKYKDRAATADGVFKVVLKGGGDGKAKVLLKGKGTELPDLPPGTLPVAPNGFPVSAQLVNASSNRCWTSAFEQADVKQNTADSFKAKDQSP